MTARKALPVGTLFMLLVITLALIGVGYALWSETLTIQGSVTTGNLDVKFADMKVSECVEVNGTLTCPEPAAKAGAANCEIRGDGNSSMEVVVTGMYPGYHCQVEFTVQSLGSVPVHVWLPKPVGTIPGWVSTNFNNCYAPGVQLHTNDKTTQCTLDLHFTNNDNVAQNSSHTFTWTILATQWNEDPLETITVQSAVFNFSGTGMAGWSCPNTHPYIVSADTSNCLQPIALSQPAKPGVGTYPVYPHYTYTPPEQGWVVQNGGTSQSCYLDIQCSNWAPAP